MAGVVVIFPLPYSAQLESIEDGPAQAALNKLRLSGFAVGEGRRA